MSSFSSYHSKFFPSRQIKVLCNVCWDASGFDKEIQNVVVQLLLQQSPSTKSWLPFWVEGKILHHHALDMSLLSCVFTLNILPFCPLICCSLGYKISFPDVCLRKYCHVSIQDALAYLLLHFTSHTGIELSHIITRITTRRSLGTTFTWLYYYILLYLLLIS